MRILHVGLGDFGTSWVRDVLVPHPAVEVVGLVDARPGRAADVRASCGLDVPVAETLTTALGTTQPDLVLLATPPATRVQDVAAAAALGAPVLVEKPAALTPAALHALRDVRARTGTRVLVAENYRFRPLFRVLAEEVARLGGPVVSVDIVLRRHHRLANYHATVPHPLLVDVASHHLDVLRYLTGQEAVALHAETWTAPGSWYRADSAAAVTGRMSDGARFSFRGELDAPVSSTGWAGSWHVTTTEGVVRVEGSRVVTTRTGGAEQVHDVSEEDGRAALLTEVIDAVRTGRSSPCDLEENARSLEIALAAATSARTGAVVRLGAPPAPEVDRATDPAGRRAVPEAPRRVSWDQRHEDLPRCHSGDGVLRHVQLLDDAAFAGPVRFVNHTVLPAGTSIGSHQHGDDEEVYVVLSGEASMTVDGTTFPVRRGDLVINQPYGTHALVNDGVVDVELLVVEVARSTPPSSS